MTGVYLENTRQHEETGGQHATRNDGHGASLCKHFVSIRDYVAIPAIIDFFVSEKFVESMIGAE